jgi:hypothetical protein
MAESVEGGVYLEWIDCGELNSIEFWGVAERRGQEG